MARKACVEGDRNEFRLKKRFLAFDLAIYALLLFVLTFMKGSNQGINIEPFAFLREYIVYKKPLGFSNIVGNMLMFVPLGFFLAIKKATVNKAFFQMFVITLMIETMQFILKRGISDIDDVILNMTGGMIGFGCYHALSTLKNRDEVLLLLIMVIFVILIILLFVLHFGLFGIYIRIF